jgi:tetratricopeptide (TPR) repeat protein
MKWIVGVWLAALLPLPLLDQIGRNNRARKEGEEAFRQGKYREAVIQFAYLTKQATPTDAVVWLNLGHAYFAMGNFAEARKAYGNYVPMASETSAAVAYTQLGVMAGMARDTTGALKLFQQALLTDPDNEPARYNFELLKKQFSGRTKASRKPKPKPKPTPQQQEQEVVRSPRQEQVLRRLRNLNMTEEQANQLLNAMREDDLPLELARRRSAGQNQSSTANKW